MDSFSPALLHASGIALPSRMPCTVDAIWIETPRLVINEFQPGDWPAWYAVFQHLKDCDQQWYNASVDVPGSVASLFRAILADRAALPRDTWRLAVRVKQDNGPALLVGYVSVCGLRSDLDGRPDVGTLLDPNFQRRGLAREAALAKQLLAFDLGATRTYAEIRWDNLASENMAQDVGYQLMHDADRLPVTVSMPTVHGAQNWRRFVLERERFLARLPAMVREMRQRCWQPVGLAMLRNGQESADGCARAA